MSRPAARITQDEVRRLIRAVQAAGLPIVRVTFDGARVDVVTVMETPTSPTLRSPATFETLEEYEAWRVTQVEGGSEGHP